LQLRRQFSDFNFQLGFDDFARLFINPGVVVKIRPEFTFIENLFFLFPFLHVAFFIVFDFFNVVGEFIAFEISGCGGDVFRSDDATRRVRFENRIFGFPESVSSSEKQVNERAKLSFNGK
jgi:hypothetical protein